MEFENSNEVCESPIDAFGAVGNSSLKGTSWMYTMNNYTDADLQRMKKFDCQYHVIGREVAPSTGTPHLQGCITFKKAIRFAGARKLLKGCHIIKPNCIEAARNYCMKEDDDVWVLDNRIKGKRTDLLAVADLVKSGAKEWDIAAQFPREYIKFSSGIKRLILMSQNHEPRKSKPKVYWFYGSTGLGKTFSVNRREESLWIAFGDLAYFNGYENQPAVLLDDFRGDAIKFHYLLQLLDAYPITISIKHATSVWNPARIYISSAKHPRDVYNKTEEDMEQLIRRIDHIVEFHVIPGTKLCIHRFVKGRPLVWLGGGRLVQ